MDIIPMLNDKDNFFYKLLKSKLKFYSLYDKN